jgi:hypothetical protein
MMPSAKGGPEVGSVAKKNMIEDVEIILRRDLMAFAVSELDMAHGLRVIDAADCREKSEPRNAFDIRGRLKVVAVEEESRLCLVFVEGLEDSLHVVIWTCKLC